MGISVSEAVSLAEKLSYFKTGSSAPGRTRWHRVALLNRNRDSSPDLAWYCAEEHVIGWCPLVARHLAERLEGAFNLIVGGSDPPGHLVYGDVVKNIMDFNSLIRAHTQGQNQGFESHLREVLLQNDEDSVSGLGAIDDDTLEGDWPQLPTEAIGDLANEASRGSGSNEKDLDSLRQLAELMRQSSWIQQNEPEPPVDLADPAVLLGLISPGMSRFDAFIYTYGDQNSCLFVGAQDSAPCTYTNYRKYRVRAHIRSHFSYEPFACNGACGREGCHLTFGDNVQLTDHLRRIGKPRIQCEVCAAYVAPQNYRRHCALTHPSS